MKLFEKHLLALFIFCSFFILAGLNCYGQTRYDWIGTSGTSSNWNDSKNWQSTTGGVTTSPATSYPQLATDTADFGVNVTLHSKNQPLLPSGVTISIAALNMGDNLAPAGTNYPITLKVNGTLNISGAFTQKHSTAGTAGSGTTYVHQIQNYVYSTGSTGGTINCASLNIGDSNVPAASSVVNVTQLKMGTQTGSGSLLAFNVSGNMTIYSPASKDASNKIISISDAEFSLAAGTLSVSGQIILSNVSTPYTIPSSTYTPLDFFSMDLFNNSDSPVLNLYGSNPISINTSGGNMNDVDFYHIYTTGGTGTATVNYAGSGNQEVYTYNATGMNSKIDYHPGDSNSGMIYNNVTFSGSGTKTVDAGTFYVGGLTVSGVLIGGNVTLSAGSETVDISTNNPTVTISGNYTSGTGSTLTKSNASALTIPGTTSNGGTFNHSGSGTVTLTGAFTNSGTYNQTGSGAVAASSTTSNSGTYNQSGTNTATFTGAVTNTGTINQTSTGGITFTGAFTNSGSSSLLKQTSGGTMTFSSSLTNGGTITQSSGAITVAGDVTNSGTGTLNMGSANFSMAGNFTNNGAFNASTGTVIFNSTTAVNLNDGSANGTTFNKVNFTSANNAVLQSGVFGVSSTGVMTLSNSGTKVTSGGGQLLFKSDINGSATLSALPNGCQIDGSNVNVQRYVSANRAYRLVSSPVYAGNDGTNNYYGLSYLFTNTYLTGDGGGWDKAGNPTLYLYRENIAPLYTTFFNSNFRGVANISNSAAILMDDSTYPSIDIPAGNGYLFFFRGSRKQASLAALTTAGAAATTDTLNAVGNLNQGTITVHNWYTPSSSNLGYTTASGDPTIYGMNLVGNPYPSSIDWDKFSSTNPSAPIYGPNVTGFSYQLIPTGLQGSGNYNVYQSGTGGLGTQNTANSNIIASGEGFFVQTSNSSASLTFTESAKTNTLVTGSNLYMGKPVATNTLQFLRLQLAKDSINTDGAIIRFNNSAKAAFNLMEDARYRVGTGKASLASLSSDGIPLAINQLPLAKNDTIRLKVGATAGGTYTLIAKNIEGIPQLFDIWLKDAVTKDSVNLRTVNSYSFTIATTDTATFGSRRFSIVINPDPAMSYQLLTFNANRTGHGRDVQVSWTAKNEQNYTHFTVERSNDNGKTFEIAGGSNSTGAGQYGLLDKYPQEGDNLYRLKQEDYFGTVSYSSTVDVRITNRGDNDHLIVFPNPARNIINLSFIPKSQGRTSYDIKITNSSGLIVKNIHVNDTDWQGYIGNLLTGTYLVQVVDKKDNNIIGQVKFVKL